MANFFDQFDQAAAPETEPTARITVNPSRPDYSHAISSIESGGNYRAIGPPTRDGDRAVGKYQVMGKNVGPWTQEVLGRQMKPMEFAADADAQEAVFKAKFGSYVDKYGPEGAAKAWFAGEKGMNDPNRRDVLGTTVESYGRKFNAAMPGATANAVPQPQQAPQQTANFFDQFDAPTSPQQSPREQLAAGLAEGKTNQDEVIRAAAWKSNQGVPKATAADLAASGATMGWGDEFSAVARAPIEMAMRGEGFSEAYSHNLAANRERLDQYKRDNPKKALASEAIGGIAGAPSRAIGKAGLIAQGVGIGGISAAGNSEGDLAERGGDAGVGAAIGGAVGAAVPAVSGLVRMVASPFTRNVSAAVNPKGRAVDAIRRDMARDGVTPGQAAAQLEESAAAGKPMTMVDVGGRNMMGLGRAVATGKSAGSEKLNAMLEARKLDAPARIVDDLKTALKDPDAFYPTLEGIIERRRAIAAPLYEKAYAQPMPDTAIVRSILGTPAGQAAVKKAQSLSANEGIEFAPDVRGLDLIKRSLDDMIDVARRGGANNEARVLGTMKDRLVREVDRKVPEYRAAREAYSSHAELEQSLVKGRELLAMEPELARKEIAAMSAADKDVARIGMAREIKAMFENPSMTLSKSNQILNSGRIKPTMEAMFPGESLAAFRNNLTREVAMLRRGQQVTGGSNTANKLAEADDINIMGAAEQVMSGRPIRAALSVAGNVASRAMKGINEKTSDRLADILTTTNPKQQRALLDKIEAMLPPGAITKLLSGVAGREAPIIQRGGI